MINTRKLANALESVIANYRAQAQKAASQNSGRLLVPSGIDYPVLSELAANPGIITSEGNRAGEPSYVSMEDAKRGRNEDGSAHGGFIVLDVLSRKVVDLLDKAGSSRIPEDERGFVNIDGHGAGYGIESAVRLLSEEMGGFLIMEDNSYPYARFRCRCPSLHADVYADKQSAENVRAELVKKGYVKANSQVRQITPEFLREYAAKRK